jgi:tetratricopeptide (TPR) repeat protein
MTIVNLTPLRRLALAAGVAFLVAIAVLSPGGSDPAPAPASSGESLGSVRPSSADTPAEIRRLQAAVRRSPAAAAPRVALAGEYLQRVRETGDAAFYSRAETLLRGVVARDPRNADALVGLGGLALSRHDFRGGLRLARRSDAGLAALPVTVDALVELGRYGEARRALQRLADLKPNLSTYARVSYLRELHGNLEGAASALALASAAGGPARENAAAIDVLHGDLALVRGRPAEARAAYSRALAAAPRYAPAEAGRARLAAFEADGGGRSVAAPRRGLAIAIRRWRGLVTRLPLPEYAIGLGEAELAAGRVRAAREDFALVRVQQRLLARAGVNTDVELAVFESDHGSAARGLRLARRAWAAAASVRSADALGWALTRSGRPDEGLRWARRARRLGSADPLFAFHAGMSARGGERRRRLRFALAHGLGARPWQAKQAREVLR